MCDIADKVTTKNKDAQYVETFTNSAELGIISQRDFFDHDVSNKDNISGYYVVDDDAFVYNPRISTSAPVGPINRNKLGRTGVMSPLYTVFKIHTVDSEYLEWFFKSTRWHSFMKFNGDSGARSDRFSIKDAVFFEMPIPIPDIEEQRKIGKYLSTLNHLITLHQRKSFYNVANITVWEQRKVGEVTKELLEYDNFNSGLPLLTSSRNGLMYQADYRGNVTTENKETLFSVVPLNACTYRHMSDDNTFHLNINTLEKGLVSREYPVFQENRSNLKFIVQYINSSDSFTKFCAEQKKGGTRTRLYYKTLCDYKLMMPSIKEQDKIANFLDDIDHLITLHRRAYHHIKRRTYKC